jgi:tetratricopeptide (TPR) repeat protein
MRRPHGAWAVAGAAVAAVVAVTAPVPTAPAQSTTTTTPTTTGPSTTAPTTTGPATPAPSTTTGETIPTVPADPPVLRNLKLPATVTARQGHARFLVGVRLSSPARVTVQVTAVKGNQLVRTVTSQGLEPAGRVYVLVEATNEQNFQLPEGRYRVRVQATDSRSRASRPLERVITLKLTTPRGRLDLDTTPLWAPLARNLGLPVRGGQLVTAVAPGGQTARAGIRRGDVIISLNGTPTLTPGEFATALRALPADTDVPVTLRRGDEEIEYTLKVSPDWNATPDLTPSHRVLLRRNPKVLAYAVAAALYQVEIGQPDEAERLYRSWPAAWRRSAAAHMVQAKILERRREPKKALGAYNRALARDRALAEAAFGRGLAYNSLGKDALAARAFGAARRLDPKDASAAAFQAFSLIRAQDNRAALEPARAAATLDPGYADAKIAEGIALIRNAQRARGVVALRQGLILTDDPNRAKQILDQYLEPNDRWPASRRSPP